MFCEIVQGEMYSEVVHDEGGVLAFEDIISAKVPVHVLVVPEEHGSSVPETRRLSDTVTKPIFEVATR